MKLIVSQTLLTAVTLLLVGAGANAQARHTQGNDISVKGSSVVGDGDTTLIAKNNVNIEAAQNTSNTSNYQYNKSSGLSSSGASVSVGKQSSSTDTTSTTTSAAASTVGSLGGNVNIVAGNRYNQVGSDLLALEGDVNVLAKDIRITEARETSTSTSETRSKQSGLTVGINSPLVSAAQTTQQQAQAASQTSSSRMQALAAGSAALNISNNLDKLKDAAQDPIGSTSFSVSLGSSKSQSSSTSTSSSARGASLNAGGNINLIASGGGQDSNILIQGSSVQAAGTVSLDAENQIRLLAAQNTTQTSSSNQSSSGSIGVGFGGPGGIGISASGNRASGNGNGTETTHTNTHIQGAQVNVKSGGDTTLSGAVIAANKVKADIGGNLTIESLSDTSSYNERQKTSGASISLSPTGVPTGGSISSGKTQLNSNYQSVGEQSGIKASDGGFEINVKGNTSLKGGAITSSQAAVDAGANSFSTANQTAAQALQSGALTLTDINNSASYNAKSSGTTLGVGTSLSSSGAGIGKDSGSAASVTTAAITGLAGNQAARTSDKEAGISPIFDADKVKKDVQAQVQITQEFGKQASQAVGNYGASKTAPIDKAKAYQDLKARQGSLSPAEAQALGKLESEGYTPDKAQADLANPRYQKDYDNWKEGGAARVALHTLTGALSGNVQGAVGAGVSQTLVPELSQEIAKLDIPVEVKQALVQAAGIGIGAATGGQAGAAAGGNATAHNFLSHIQAKDLQKDMGACKSKKAGCSDSEERAIRDKYIGLSNENIDKVKQMIVAGDVQGIQQLEAQAASSAAVSGLFSTRQDEEIFTGRQNNVNYYGGIKGTNSLFGSDAQQAQEVNAFRQQQCQGLSAQACNGLVQQALDARMDRVLVLGAVGAAVPLTVRGVQGLRANPTAAKAPTAAADAPADAKVATVAPRAEAPNNGLPYESNDKHTPGTNGYDPKGGIEPRNSFDLFGNSVAHINANNGKETRYTVDANGEIHRFSNDGNGIWHWSGSSADVNNPLAGNAIPTEIRRLPGVNSDIRTRRR
jgi:filamentous hemagglutinin